MPGPLARAGVILSLVLAGIAATGPVRGARSVAVASSVAAGIVHSARIAAPVDSAILKAYRWRSVGPDRGGRSLTVTGVRGQPKLGYFGATGGGLWKTTDGGTTWAPITDNQITSASVGAVAVSESNPDVIFIGTGEACIRGDIRPGDGVYKSTDGGKTWTHVGFKNSDAIAKIRIHPTNPDIVFVADFGKYGVPSDERGLYKTTDGGKTWRKVLDRGPKTGAVDISIDPHNPNVIFAAMWEAYRNEYTMSSGGAGSGLFKSTDGGDTWTEITRAPGLPAGVDGKIGVAVSGADPNRVYAIVENEHGGLFKSDDGGANWSLANDSRNIRQRAFYYTHISADPKNKDLLYILNVGTVRSTDAGKTLNQFAGGDSHDIWIDPDNSEHVMHASDGGGAITYNASSENRTWSSRDYPTGQFYHVVATTHVPYHVCGSQQDASEMCVPSNTGLGGFGGRGGGGGRGAGPATYSPGGSEDGYIAPDPRDPDVFYSGTNANGGGFLTKLNRRTGETREVSPYPRMFSGEESAVIKERWQWTYPIVFSPVDTRVLYTGSQHLWKTTNGGQSWDRISPDLTRHDPKTMGPSGGPITRDMNGPEVYAVIFSIAPSKRTVNVVWTGSDDGIVEVTKDAGKTWSNVTPKDMPDLGRVSLIDASSFDSATAYVAVKKFLLDDKAPYIFRTHDFGKTWTKITHGIRDDDFVHAVREDPTRKGLLYATTEHGVYISYDDGDNWSSLRLNLPDVPVTSLIVTDHDLAIATHGRGFYILDNIGPLRQFKPAMAASSDPVLFAPSTMIRSGGAEAIQYWLKQPAQNVRIDILDAKGALVRTYPDTTTGAGGGRGGRGGAGGGAPADSNAGRGGGGRGRGGFGGPVAPPRTAGLDSFSWDGAYAPAVSFPGMILWGGATNGPEAAPGRYQVRLTVDGKTSTQPITLKRNPWHDATDADLIAQQGLALQIRDKVSEANRAILQIRGIKTEVTDRLGKSSDDKLKTVGDRLSGNLSGVEENVYQVRNQSGQDPLNFPIKVNNRLASLLGVVSRSDAKPIASAYPIFEDLKSELRVETDHLQKILVTDLPAFNTELKRLGLDPIVLNKPVIF